MSPLPPIDLDALPTHLFNQPATNPQRTCNLTTRLERDVGLHLLTQARQLRAELQLTKHDLQRTRREREAISLELVEAQGRCERGRRVARGW